MNPGGGSGWDEPPLDIQIPDDARELDRDVLAYHREQRARRRRKRLRRLAGPFSGQGTVMPLLASILAVCLVAGAMLSVATFSPASEPGNQAPGPAVTATGTRPAPTHGTAPTSPASASASRPSTSASGTGRPSASRPSTSASGTSRPSASASGTGQASRAPAASTPAASSPAASSPAP